MNTTVRHWHRIAAVIAAIGLVGAMSGCHRTESAQEPTEPAAEPAGPITVVASVNQWGSLAAQIGGDDVTVTSIVNTTAVDAHDFEPQTADVATLQQAQVVVCNGAGYDTWATKSLSQDAIAVSAAETVGATEGDNPHLWFSKDARNSMATELAEAFSKALPEKKEQFQKRLADWQERERTLEQSMDDFSQAHPDATYAATESVAYYLMSDLGFKDATPQGYAQSAANEAEPAPADLQEFQSLIEDRGVDLLVNNTQQAGDATNMITGTAGRAEVPVFDVSEQMPTEFTDLTDWITSLVDAINALLPTDTAEDGATESTEPQDGNDSSTSDTSTDESATEDSTVPSNEGQQDPGR